MTSDTLETLSDNIQIQAANMFFLSKGRNFPNKRRRARKALDKAIMKYVIAFANYYSEEDDHEMVWYEILKYALRSAKEIMDLQRSVWY
jgi:hypothetical protein